MGAQESVETREPEELIVISDLHLSDGYDETTGKYSRNEDFFFDEEFKRFLEYLEDNKTCKIHLIINGDMFDFLQVDPNGERIKEYQEFVEKSEEDSKKYGLGTDEDRLEITDKEKEFGLGTGRAKTVWKLGLIVRGHKEFFEALANFLYEENRLTIITGNHDIELYWPCVREALKDYVAEQFEADKHKDSIKTKQEREGPDKKKESIKAKIDFCHWFYYNEDFHTYIEHGNQYDNFNSFEYFLYPHLEHDSAKLWVPFGSYFVRYFFNRLETVHPFADNIKPISKYAQWAWSEDKLLLLKVVLKQFIMMFDIFRRRKEFSRIDKEKLDIENKFKLKGLKENKPHFNGIDEVFSSLEMPLTSRRLSIFLFFTGTIFFVITVIALVVLIVLRIFFKIPLFAILSPLGLLLVPIGKQIYYKYFKKGFFEKNMAKIQNIKCNLKDVRTIIFGHTHNPPH
jgi:UDP-2,3-diacylglucosamine pyrophosphatase LpxH